MQIFLISENPIDIARCLDKKRLNKQVLECDWILNGWVTGNHTTSHPIAKMYKDHLDWIELYKQCLKSYREGNENEAIKFSKEANKCTPEFLKDQNWYFDNFKRRLYTKDKIYYKSFESLGESFVNYYLVNGKWIEYKNRTKK